MICKAYQQKGIADSGFLTSGAKKAGVAALLAAMLLASFPVGSSLAATPTLTFGSLTNLSSNSGSSATPVVTSSGTNVYVAWTDNSGGGKSMVFFAASHDSGLTFPAPLRHQFSGIKSDAKNLRIFAQGPSNVYLAWVQGGKQIYFAYSHDGGMTFSSPVNMSNDLGPDLSPVVSASGTSVFLAWEDESNQTTDGKRAAFDWDGETIIAYAQEVAKDFAKDAGGDFNFKPESVKEAINKKAAEKEAKKAGKAGRKEPKPTA